MTTTMELPPRDDRGWIQTFSGRQAWPLNPQPEDISIEDIAHALSMICRYTGHVREFYSVAQHSVIASYAVPPQDALWALLHDATEAYLCDVARPVKPFLGDYKAIERRLMDVVSDVFGLDRREPDSVKQVDLILLATERRDLMADPPVPWLSTENIEPLPERIVPWSPAEAERRFLGRFGMLMCDRLMDRPNAPAASPPPAGPGGVPPFPEGGECFGRDGFLWRKSMWVVSQDGAAQLYDEAGDEPSAWTAGELRSDPGFHRLTADEAHRRWAELHAAK